MMNTMHSRLLRFLMLSSLHTNYTSADTVMNPPKSTYDSMGSTTISTRNTLRLPEKTTRQIQLSLQTRSELHNCSRMNGTTPFHGSTIYNYIHLRSVNPISATSQELSGQQ